MVLRCRYNRSVEESCFIDGVLKRIAPLTVSAENSIDSLLRSWADRFNDVLDTWLPENGAGHASLVEAMRYSALGPGKRIRPYLVARCCELAGGREEDAIPAAVAIECVHAFSLVHDDLPAMDDDAVRRGRPTTHIVYGEAMAVLTGDALLNFAYQILSTRITDPAVAVASVRALSRAVGADGMIGGQACDMLSEKAEPSEALLSYLHLRKTARLFEASCRLGAIAAHATPDVSERLSVFGRHFGLAFQMADDLLDVCGSVGQVGKAVGKDSAAGKQTYPSLLGVEGARQAARREAQAASDALDAVDASADDLRRLAEFVIERTA